MLTRDAALHYTYRFQTEILYWFHTAKEVNSHLHARSIRDPSSLLLNYKTIFKAKIVWVMPIFCRLQHDEWQ